MKVDDWVVFDLRIGQLRRADDDGFGEFSDGMFCTSGRILDRCRPLTLRNKNIIENFDYYYRELRKIDGSGGFNFPDIAAYFAHLSLEAIDHKGDIKDFIAKAIEFVTDAKLYKPTIQGIKLFRRTAA